MNTFDIIIVIIIFVGLIFGLFRGLIKEVAGLAAIFLGIYFSKILAPTVGAWLVKSLNVAESVSVPVAYLVIFVAVIILLLAFSALLDKLINAIALGWLNRLFGGIFGAIKLALLVSVLLNVFDALDGKYHFVAKETKTESRLYQPIMKFAPMLWQEM
jgi:membrane protein required for colicin V production